MDGSRSFFCSVRVSDHWNSDRHEAVKGVLQKLLYSTLSPDLASLLFGDSVYVCDCAVSASIRSTNLVRRAVLTMVVFPVVPTELSCSDSDQCNRTIGCHLVARSRGTILPGVASGGAVQ